MGYTHYWKLRKKSENFNNFSNACKKLYENLNSYKNLPSPIVIKNSLGEGKPVFDKTIVAFNGDGDKGLDHESFVVMNDETDFEFCKTARKPYDILAGACLLAGRDLINLEISSDGDINDWFDIAKFYNAIIVPKNLITPKILIKLFGDYENNFINTHSSMDMNKPI